VEQPLEHAQVLQQSCGELTQGQGLAEELLEASHPSQESDHGLADKGDGPEGQSLFCRFFDHLQIEQGLSLHWSEVCTLELHCGCPSCAVATHSRALEPPCYLEVDLQSWKQGTAALGPHLHP
jgi:hypothetical protein